jgi:acyl-CoA synthetase (AMP-forming)/AMP-acid ligase II
VSQSWPLTRWLMEPDAERGIRFAQGGGGWDQWSYEQLAALVARVAGGLLDAGVRPGEVVAIVERSTPGFVAAVFGVLLAGATPSPIAPPIAFQREEEYAKHITGLLTCAKPSVVLCGATLRETVAPLAERAHVPLLVDIQELMAGAATMDSPRPPAEIALMQFTSGTSGCARGVLVPASSLAANIDAIRRWLAMTPTDATASWLPLHHDMGLIGCMLTPVVNGSDLWILPPEEFIRSPLRYLRCFDSGGARLTAMPCFGLAYIARRVTRQAIQALDLREWRAIIVGAERLDAQVLERFHERLESAGLRRRALMPAYGLAEATLAVTGSPLDESWRSLAIDPATLVLGAEVQLAVDRHSHRVVGCGRSLAGVHATVRGADGAPLKDRIVGEIFVAGDSVAAGYATPDDGSFPSQIAAGTVRTGDAGFIADGELFVLGRLGDALKIRGRAVFAEELEALAAGAGIPGHRVAAALGERGGEPTLVLVMEEAEPSWRSSVEPHLRRRTAGANIVFVNAPLGTIERTSSGKPRRRSLWTAFSEGRLTATAAEGSAANRSTRPAHV